MTSTAPAEAVDAVVEPDPGVAVDELGHRRAAARAAPPRPAAPGRSVRSSSQAAPAPMHRAERRARATTSSTVLRSSSSTCGQAQEVQRAWSSRRSRPGRRRRPAAAAATAPIGSASSQSGAGPSRRAPARPCRPDAAARAHGLEQPDLLQHVERGLAVAELRRAHAARARCRRAGARPCVVDARAAAGTRSSPRSAMIVWAACSPGRRGSACASAACLLDCRTAAPETSTSMPGSRGAK